MLLLLLTNDATMDARDWFIEVDGSNAVEVFDESNQHLTEADDYRETHYYFALLRPYEAIVQPGKNDLSDVSDSDEETDFDIDDDTAYDSFVTADTGGEDVNIKMEEDEQWSDRFLFNTWKNTARFGELFWPNYDKAKQYKLDTIYDCIRSHLPNGEYDPEDHEFNISASMLMQMDDYAKYEQYWLQSLQEGGQRNPVIID